MAYDHTVATSRIPTVKGIRTITVDLDDTLWEIHPVIQRAERRLYEWLGEYYPRITARFSVEAMRTLRDDVMEEHRDKLHDLTLIRRAVLTRAANAAGYTEFRLEEAFAVFDEVRNDVDLFPEARPALMALRERFTVIAVTNGNANLEKIGIGDLFDAHVNAAMAGAAKPHRPIFDAAVKAGRASAEETLHVGDHPFYDVHGAREAGLRTVWVNRNGDSWPQDYDEADLEIRHVGELPELMR
jgi:putative hydrolase of the HAD superfamily